MAQAIHTLRHSPEVQAFPTGLGSAVKYVGEGMANVVFSFPEAQDSMRDLLIRVPKDVTGDHEEIHKHWCENVYPLFESRDLVPQYLVKIEGQDDILVRLRSELEAAETKGQRKSKMKGTKIKTDIRTAMLIHDMRPRNDNEILIEFKPKWLEQSPTAPKDATRCRNCAREAYRNNKKGTGDSILCPLRFMDRAGEVSMARVKEFITKGLGISSGSPAAITLEKWLRENTLLPHLHDAQVSNDSTGVLEPKDQFKLGLAMTLRDCTCYVRLSRQGSSIEKVEARLGDLDLKDQTTKLDYWRDMELELQEQGYYLSNEKPQQKTDCLLS
ncbi:hypothetical protein MGG_05177 [Pyricularia oryzae 70-15]|uniref:Inositol-pentakisphosphate 2-kinase n=3 Tax=Pyricularia oryzae TaxID=318829 RepID=G4N4Z8_PYRO7|nr:uncharacterized protein MGG_05177 [Pyricularia oryzae 70-15]EHA52909.1 hypothetical protein MGG_05177 [Pyricularia oryzae 70-15]ELQ39029.1 hypothetical protein OOU_Y34scaffold00516g64 [Pyricularia oryzae Y34]KAI7927659.1 hypothetical protein M0657_003061 [Pyricularia oryzae]KAI7930592.1 hypothetical protein M9X92_000656 [Pyricularia oryzae]